VFYFPVFRTNVNDAFLRSLDCSFQRIWLDEEAINVLFAQEEKLRNVFKKFLKNRFIGLAWHSNSEWVSYAWMSTPETLGPIHLPRGIQRLPIYWIFYCRTKVKYQGKGLFKASLTLLVHWVRERDPQAEIYIDTEEGNIPSRRAIKTVGFTPRGIITTWSLRLPKLSLVLWGRWDQNLPHVEVAK